MLIDIRRGRKNKEVELAQRELPDVIVTDIFNRRDGKRLRPTGYMPTFIDTLVEQDLLDLEFLYDK